MILEICPLVSKNYPVTQYIGYLKNLMTDIVKMHARLLFLFFYLLEGNVKQIILLQIVKMPIKNETIFMQKKKTNKCEILAVEVS